MNQDRDGSLAADDGGGEKAQVVVPFDTVYGQQHVSVGATGKQIQPPWADNFVVKLRKKLEDDASSPRHIVTIYGIGGWHGDVETLTTGC